MRIDATDDEKSANLTSDALVGGTSVMSNIRHHNVDLALSSDHNYTQYKFENNSIENNQQMLDKQEQPNLPNSGIRSIQSKQMIQNRPKP